MQIKYQTDKTPVVILGITWSRTESTSGLHVEMKFLVPVSYTHLTLPTTAEV